jgi:hypothetical protein
MALAVKAVAAASVAPVAVPPPSIVSNELDEHDELELTGAAESPPPPRRRP